MSRIIFIFLVLHLTAFFIMLIFIFLGFYQLSLFSESLVRGNISRGRAILTITGPTFAVSSGIKKVLAAELGLIRRENLLNGAGDMLRIGEEINGAGKHLMIGMEDLKKLTTSLFNNAEYDVSYLSQIKADLAASREKLTRAIFIMEKAQLPIFKKEIAQKSQELSGYRDLLEKTVLFLDISPQALGFETEKTYLVLLQNNMELRPTGGFIGSYALMIFNKGKITKFEIYDVYSADGQLKGHIEPPLPIRRYLEQPNWYLRDANWDPDFTATASKAAWFLEKEVGVKVDGVISIDVSLIGLVLDTVGNVYLPDYQETITRDNLFERANFYAHKDFFAGSSGKADFLGSLSRMLFEKLQNSENLSWPRLLLSLSSGIEEKHLMIALFDQRIQSLLSFYDMSGEVKAGNKKEEGFFYDFFMAIDANLGVNKVNYFVKRSIEYLTTISDEGEVTITAKILYINQSPSQAYKNYLRLFTMSGAELIDVWFDGNPVQSIDKEEGEKNSHGFYITIPGKTQKTVIARYSLPGKMIVGGGQTKYILDIVKQPGTLSDLLTVGVKYPTFFNLSRTEIPDQAKSFEDQHNFISMTNLTKDRRFSMEFVNK